MSSPRARAIRCGDTREGQIATAPPASRALAKAKRGLRKKRKRCSGCHRKRRISARFHQAMPLATAIGAIGRQRRAPGGEYIDRFADADRRPRERLR
jgi:hypothetical protein